jgi:4'-phosphopantetheinyl transferase
MTSTSMEKEKIHLWYAYPDDLLQQNSAKACARLLSEDEQTRWQSFKFEEHRREYLATHALARTALSYHGKLSPEAWRFRPNAYGKPAVVPECGLRFNLSNSRALVVCLVAESADVGVDVEPYSRAQTILEVAPSVFSLLELRQLEALKPNDKITRALQLWTLKEAYIKARGIGLQLPLRKFSFQFDEEQAIRMVLDADLNDRPDRWQFCLLEHSDHCVALMVESRTPPDLVVMEARTFLSSPGPLKAGQPSWFPYAAKSS